MKLVCQECNRENDPQRIYCHDCGARLDRSALAKVKAAEEEKPAETQRRVAAMFSPGRALMRKRFFNGSRLLLGALLLAVLVQMLRPPELPERQKALQLPVPMGMDLENAVSVPGAAPLRYTDEQVNAYLAYALKSKQAVLSKYLQFERVVVGFEEGYARFTVERSIFGYSLYTSASYSANIQNGNIVATGRGLHIGRMPIHPAVMKYADVVFSDVRSALERERKSIAKLSAIEFQPKTVVLTPKPRAN